jgi:hypothetical protein
MGIIVTVIISRGVFKCPIAPPTIRAGAILGIMPIKPVLTLLNTIIMGLSFAPQ